MKNSRAHYLASPTKEAVFITDLGEGVSVTNDAEAVVADILAEYPGRRIIYCDTDGTWDELLHDGVKFVNFAPLTAWDRARFAAYL